MPSGLTNVSETPSGAGSATALGATANPSSRSAVAAIPSADERRRAVLSGVRSIVGQSSARAWRRARVSTCVHTLVVASRWGGRPPWENPGVNAVEVIGRKRDGAANTPEEIRFLL